MDLYKVAAVKDWEPPECTIDVRMFIGFSNFYWQFIKYLSDIVRLMTALTGKDVRFNWSDRYQQAFKMLKTVFPARRILAHIDRDKRILVETDASDLRSAGVLLQYNDDDILQPVAFYSKKPSPVEAN